MESMRAVGYTLEAAIADLIDNSITAEARHVEVHFATEPRDYVVVLDDGRGMTADEARQGMRLAGTSPATERSPHDLGRFGLGLKTASLSQCRDLVLVSKKANDTCAFQWNLDHLERTRSWSLIRLDPAEIKELPDFGGISLLVGSPSSVPIPQAIASEFWEIVCVSSERVASKWTRAVPLVSRHA